MTQTVIVAVVVLAALAYVGRRAWAALRPARASEPGCGDGCGCSPAGAGRDWAES